VKSSDCIDLLSRLQTSKAYSKIGKHFCFRSWTVTITFSEANLPTLVDNNNIIYFAKGQVHQKGKVEGPFGLVDRTFEFAGTPR